MAKKIKRIALIGNSILEEEDWQASLVSQVGDLFSKFCDSENMALDFPCSVSPAYVPFFPRGIAYVDHIKRGQELVIASASDVTVVLNLGHSFDGGGPEDHHLEALIQASNLLIIWTPTSVHVDEVLPNDVVGKNAGVIPVNGSVGVLAAIVLYICLENDWSLQLNTPISLALGECDDDSDSLDSKEEVELEIEVEIIEKLKVPEPEKGLQ